MKKFRIKERKGRWYIQQRQYFIFWRNIGAQMELKHLPIKITPQSFDNKTEALRWLHGYAEVGTDNKLCDLCLEAYSELTGEDWFYCWDCDGALGNMKKECCQIVAKQLLHE